MDYITEPEKKIPIHYKADVVVVGCGTSGIAVAVTAARLGLKVACVERSSLPGGLLTQTNHWINDFDNKGGFVSEVMDYLSKNKCLNVKNYNPFILIPYFDQLLCEHNIRHYFLAYGVAPILDGNRITGVIMESKSGRTAITAQIVIDATGDGDIAAGAGADFQFGRETDGITQPISQGHIVTNFNNEPIMWEKLEELIDSANKANNTDFALPYKKWRPYATIGTKSMLFSCTPHVSGVNAISADELSDALITLRRQATDIFDFFKANLKEFDAIEYGPFFGLPGVRESRRIICEDTVTYDDVLTGRTRENGIFTVAQNIDIHRRDEKDPDIIVEHIKPYHMPYGALIPKKIDNLFVIGRCIGGEHEAEASYRIMPDCMAMGEAAGIASKLSIEKSENIREIDASEIATEMRQRGYLI